MEEAAAWAAVTSCGTSSLGCGGAVLEARKALFRGEGVEERNCGDEQLQEREGEMIHGQR